MKGQKKLLYYYCFNIQVAKENSQREYRTIVYVQGLGVKWAHNVNFAYKRI